MLLFTGTDRICNFEALLLSESIMKPRRLSPVFRSACGVCLLAALSACSLLHRHHASEKTPDKARSGNAIFTANARGLALELKFSPDPVKLGEVREISVNLIVRNVSKQPATLKFATTQILEIVLRDVATGEVVSKWSTDRTFSDDNRIVDDQQGRTPRIHRTSHHQGVEGGQDVQPRNVLHRLREGTLRQEGAHSPALIPRTMALFQRLPHASAGPPGCNVTARRCCNPGSTPPANAGCGDIALTDHDRYHEGVDFAEIDLLRRQQS